MATKKSNVKRYLEEVKKKVPTHWLVWEQIMEKMEDAKRMEVLNRDTMIDTSLKDLLYFQFSREEKEVDELLFDPQRGTLATMTSKAKLAYALGLIDKTTLNDLGKIHNIRNRFAHNTDMNFESDEVHKEVRKLSIAKGKKKSVWNSYKLYNTASKACSSTVLKAVVKEVNKVSERIKIKKKKKVKKKRTQVK